LCVFTVKSEQDDSIGKIASYKCPTGDGGINQLFTTLSTGYLVDKKKNCWIKTGLK